MSIKFVDIRGSFRGHPTKLDNSKLTEEEKDITNLEYNKKYGIGKWIYCDTLELISDERPCAKCNKVFSLSTPDACLGELENVTGACCGHGVEYKKYVNVIDEETKKGYSLRRDYYDMYMESKNFQVFKKTYIELTGDISLNGLSFMGQLKKFGGTPIKK